MSEKLLIVEDDKKLNDGIRLALKNDAYFFYQCRTLQEAREILKKEDITLVLLDVNLPDGNGIDFVREIRKNSQVPIILLTVNNMEVDIVTGLEAGANDYITKPFSLMVLRARVSVQLRNKEAAAKNSMELDGFEFYFDKMEFFKDGEPIELSKTEQKLLRVLCENRGKVLKREYLIATILEQTEKLDFLIQSLVKLSRMESGIIAVHSEDTTIKQMLESIQQQFNAKVREKNITLSLCDTDLHVRCDAKWTVEALGNIVDNAIKYTACGGNVQIKVEQYSFFVKIDIIDDGIGIEKEKIPKIFGRFYRSLSVADQPGVGIGLFLAREIIQAQALKVSLQGKSKDLLILLSEPFFLPVH